MINTSTGVTAKYTINLFLIISLEKNKKKDDDDEEEEEEEITTTTTIQIITINGMLLFSTTQTCFFNIQQPTGEMENYYSLSLIFFQYSSCLSFSITAHFVIIIIINITF
jgi:hypothetical protein